MDYAQALARFAAHCPPDDAPVLTEDQVEEALAEAVAVDSSGYRPADALWTATYSTLGVVRAIVRGWEMKTGALAGAYDFTTDGQSFRRSQMVDHCEAMADRHRRRLVGSAGVAS